MRREVETNGAIAASAVNDFRVPRGRRREGLEEGNAVDAGGRGDEVELLRSAGDRHARERVDEETFDQVCEGQTASGTAAIRRGRTHT